MTILAMLISETAVILYPVQVLCGSGLLMLATRLLFMRRQLKREAKAA